MFGWVLGVMKNENDVHLKCVNLLLFSKVSFTLLTGCHIEYFSFLNKSFFNDKVAVNKNMLLSTYGGNQMISSLFMYL